ncbi:MAG: HNH endonuclease family protein [Candidatus Nanopelagicales bacterium]
MLKKRQIGLPVILGSALILLFNSVDLNISEPPLLNAPQEVGKKATLELLSNLLIATEARAGYERELFMTSWSDLDQDGCDSRREVLIAESLTPVELIENCKIVSGSWYSIYDALETTDPQYFDVDHFVPLAEAWDSGASRWSNDRRVAFANDLTDPDFLIAVSRESNRDKGDRDPAEWLPILPQTHCWYVTTWVSIKHRWQLSVDQKEFEEIEKILNKC